MSESHYKYKTNCPDCGSSDALAVYTDSNTHCFSCKKTTFAAGGVGKPVTTGVDYNKLLTGDFRPIPHRKLKVETCKKYGYTINDTYKDHCDTYVADYHNETGALIAQHITFMGDKGKKDCRFLGSPQHAKTLRMFGQHLFAAGGKLLVLCEGQVDAMSAYQALQRPCVGIAGTDRVEKIVKANLEYIESFEKVICMFDDDDPGRAATKVALNLISYGKAVSIVNWKEECNDANDVLVKHGEDALRKQIYFNQAKHQVDGVLDVADVVFVPDDFEVSLYPWPSFNHKLFARRSGELTVWTSGTGMGKSTILRAIYADLLAQGESCAMIMLEESTAETKADLMSCLSGIPIRKVMAQMAVNKAMVKKGMSPLFPDVEPIDATKLKELEVAVDKSGMILIDHSKGYDTESILSQIRFLAVSKGVKHILLDHITILIASDAEYDNDVKQLDIVMKKIRMICEETGVSIDMISHIRKRSNGAKSANGGAQIAIEELRGSGSLAQIANNVIAFERDQQSEDPNITICRSLKSRMGGFTGTICSLRYNPETGELAEYEDEDDGGGYSDKTQTAY